MRRAIVLASGLLIACQSQVLLPQGQGGAGGERAVEYPICAGATPELATDGYDSGFVVCPDGTTNRAQPVTCDTTVVAPACGGNESQFSCHADADCTEKPHGACISDVYYGFGGPEAVCSCIYPCATDADCNVDEACVCRGLVTVADGWSRCAQKHDCTSSKDCPSGECGLSVDKDGCGRVSVDLVCRTPSDECHTDVDCADGGYGAHCTTNGGISWSCISDQCHT
jgi:hypothetical protein